MHPAPSIIVFTVFSGLGFGLMIWLGLGAVDVSGGIAATFCAMAFAFSILGLLASLFHLGHPERAFKAFSQWRSSWLSREGVLSVATLLIFGLYSAIWVLFDIRSLFLGGTAALLAFGTVFCTSMIYAQMKSVPRWNSALTPVVFLLASLTGGALVAGTTGAVIFLVMLAIAVGAEWLRGARSFAASGSSLATALGMGNGGVPRMLAPPHTGQNYLLREMVYVIARDHAKKLFLIGSAASFLLPLLLLVLLPSGHLAFGLAIILHIGGMLTLRWLFFAQAEHVVGLYYGKR